ncbi:MAG: glutamate--tRNA ligase [Candidatus Moranbacteria bacterium]|nr:glutamate--tRNA ligase [Candidatus Moranbacteria bacterium]
MSRQSVRVRFAPSPTGFLHIGGLRTALFNYLFARRHGGQFILRIEDTDRTRFVDGAVENLLNALSWAGLSWDEGPKDNRIFNVKNVSHRQSDVYSSVVEVGEKGPYIQSERIELYRRYADELVQNGQAYYAFDTAEELTAMREAQTVAKQVPMYDRRALNLSASDVQKKISDGVPHVVRLKVPRGERIVFEDLVRGHIEIDTDTIDDQVLLKSDGFPTYHLANVVDDYLMGITHVIRGEEWLPSTPKHLLLYRAFGWKEPHFAHLSLLLNPDRSKLSKRQGDVSVEDYCLSGYTSEALVNFVALLGWNPGAGNTQEIFSLDALVELFDLSGINKAGAVFDRDKLDWMNGQYIKNMTVEDLYDCSIEFLSEKDFFLSASSECKTKEYLLRVLTLEQERLERLALVGDSHVFFFRTVSVNKDLLRWKNNSDQEIQEALTHMRMVVSNLSLVDWTREKLLEVLLGASGEKRGDFLWPLRISLSGEKKSPPPQDLLWVLGKEESLRRIDMAIALFDVEK